MKTPTRAELMVRIDQHTSAYLGFDTQMGGIGSMIKADLLRLERAMGAMATLEARARKLESLYTLKQRDNWCLLPLSEWPADLLEARRLAAEAQKLWRAGSRRLIEMDRERHGDWSGLLQEGEKE